MRLFCEHHSPSALLATRGYAEEVEQAYACALDLCMSAGEVPQLFPVLRGLASFYILRSEFEKGAQIGERILELAERLDDMDMRVEGYLVLGENATSLDNVSVGLGYLEKAIAAFDLDRPRVRRLGLGSNPGVVALNVSALFLWMLGRPEAAKKRAEDAVALARKIGHPFTLSYALFHHGLVNLWLGNLQVTQSSAQELMDLAAEHDFQIWSAVAACLPRTAMVFTGAIEEGLALIEPGIAAYRGLKTPPVFWPILLCMQAAAYRAASRFTDGLAAVEQALDIASTNSGTTLRAEGLCLKGELLLAADPKNALEAESLFQDALYVSQQLQTTMLELRAALKLSRLWQAQGKTEQARTLLGETFGKLTEGFAAPDLLAAQALLKELE